MKAYGKSFLHDGVNGKLIERNGGIDISRQWLEELTSLRAIIVY